MDSENLSSLIRLPVSDGTKTDISMYISFIDSCQSELPRPIPRNSVESDHGCTSRIYFDKAGDNVTLTLYNVTITSQKPC